MNGGHPDNAQLKSPLLVGANAGTLWRLSVWRTAAGDWTPARWTGPMGQVAEDFALASLLSFGRLRHSPALPACPGKTPPPLCHPGGQGNQTDTHHTVCRPFFFSTSLSA